MRIIGGITGIIGRNFEQCSKELSVKYEHIPRRPSEGQFWREFIPWLLPYRAVDIPVPRVSGGWNWHAVVFREVECSE